MNWLSDLKNWMYSWFRYDTSLLAELKTATAQANKGICDLLKLLEKMTMTLDDVVAKLEALKTVDDSVVALLENLSQLLKDAIASNDPAKIQAVADMLDAEKQRLADAVTANTPSA